MEMGYEVDINELEVSEKSSANASSFTLLGVYPTQSIALRMKPKK
jgi:hypothetical protein